MSDLSSWVVGQSGTLRDSFPDVHHMVVVLDNGNNTYNVRRPGWGANRQLTSISNVNPDLAGQIHKDDTVVVGAYSGNPQQWAILSKAGFMLTDQVAADVGPTPVLVVFVQWARVGRLESWSRDTGDRNGSEEIFGEDVQGVWQLPTSLTKHTDGVVACARVAANRVWYLKLNTDWELHAVHFDAALSTETDPLGSRSWTLDSLQNQLPLTMTLQPLPDTELLDVYTTWCGRPPE